MFSRGGSLLPSASADVRASDDVIAFTGVRGVVGQVFVRHAVEILAVH